MASDKEIVKVDYIEKETWDTLLNGGGGGGGESEIVRVPFAIDATQAEITGSTDAVFADALAARKSGKLIVATGTVNVGLAGVTQYFDCIMSGIDAENDSRLEGVFLMLSGSGTKLEVYDIKWTPAGVTVTKKDSDLS